MVIPGVSVRLIRKRSSCSGSLLSCERGPAQPTAPGASPSRSSPAACRGNPALLGSGDCHRPWLAKCCARLGLEGSCVIEVGHLQKKCLLADPCFGLPRFLWFSYCLFLFPAKSGCFAPPGAAPGCSLFFRNPLFRTTKGVLQPVWPWCHVCSTLAICILW